MADIVQKGYRHSFYVETRPPVTRTGKNERVVSTGKKRRSKTIDIVSYALKVSINGVICMFVAHFRSSGTSESL